MRAGDQFSGVANLDAYREKKRATQAAFDKHADEAIALGNSHSKAPKKNKKSAWRFIGLEDPE